MKTASRLFLLAVLGVVLTTGLHGNGLNLNGFGSRATAMGGAYVGLANDYTAVFWNPAGLATLTGPTFGLGGDILIPSGKYALGPYSMETERKYYPAGILGYFQPLGENIVVGVGAYTLSGLGAVWENAGLEAVLISPAPPALFTPAVEPYDWTSFIGSITVAPSIAVKLSEQFYLGATFNINYGFFKTEQWAGFEVIPLKPTPVYLNFGQQTLDVKGWGFGATFGALVKPAEWISLGATFRTQSKIKLSGTTEIEHLDGLSPYVGGIDIATESDTSMSVASPMWLAGGVALMPTDNLTLTFDVQYTNWAKLDKIAVEFDDEFWGANLGEEAALLLNWANKTQIRAGAEYDFGKFALRGGYYYDPAPAPDETLNILVPSFTYNGIAGGFGYKSGGFKLDFCLEYLKGKQRTIDPSEDNLPGIYDLKILAPSFSLTFSF